MYILFDGIKSFFELAKKWAAVNDVVLEMKLKHALRVCELWYPRNGDNRTFDRKIIGQDLIFFTTLLMYNRYFSTNIILLFFELGNITMSIDDIMWSSLINWQMWHISKLVTLIRFGMWFLGSVSSWRVCTHPYISHIDNCA